MDNGTEAMAGFPGASWLRFWTLREQFSRRRAYFRPIDAYALDAALLPLVDHIVTVRPRKSGADAGQQGIGQRLYRILGHGLSRQFVRPERDFDFLE